MSNVNANINVTIQTQQAVVQLRQLTAEINNFNRQSFATNSAAAKQQKALSQALIDGVKTSGQFATSIVPISNAVDNFSTSLERNRLSLGQYTRYATSQLPGMRKVFTREFDMIGRVAEDRVKRINTQFVSLGQSANGTQKALAMMPNSLDQFSAKSAIALQRQQLFNKLLGDGSTKLLNWGKNTQWAGRQLMVGFTIPLGILGVQAAKVFKELEAEAINFKKVYGDMFTTDAEVEKNLEAIKELSVEMTKYGQTAQQTMQLANTAAQSGARGAELMAATTQATRLAILGQMEQSQAIETTISLQTAFAMSNEELAESINFLNSVENQTILSLQDVSEAIPRVASVIKGFGGNVQDLSVLLVAMKEGGVSASEGANALKNSMARIISPTRNALDVSAKYGIALQDIVARNDGKVVPLFQELAKVLEALGGQPRQEVLSAVFGKFQYARIGTLLSNIAKEGSQASTAIELTGVATRDLAATAERELSTVEDSISTKFTAALEKAKIALAPIGGEFLKALTPVLEFVGSILEKFDQLPGGIKTAIVAATAIIGGVAPIVLMVVGLVANGIANISKFVMFLRKQIAILRGNGEQFKFYARAELDASAAASTLEGKTSSLTRTMVLQKPAIETLITLYTRLAASARVAAAAMPATMGMPMVGKAAGAGAGAYGLKWLAPQKRNKGGAIFSQNGTTVPGSGNTDTVPAMLTPGEFVINKKSTKKNLSLIQAINNGEKVPGYNIGGMIAKKITDLRSYLSARHGATTKRNWVDPLNSSEMRSGAIHGPGVYQSNMAGRAREYSGLADLRLAVNRDGFVYRNPRDPMSIAKVLKGKGYISLDEVKARGLGTDVASYKQLRSEGYKGVTIPQGNGEVWTVDFSSKMKLASSKTPFGLKQATTDWKQLRNVQQSEKRYNKANTPKNNSNDDFTLNKGGFIGDNKSRIVPGTGNTDTVPAMLTPGEFVVNKKSTQKNLPLLRAINGGNVQKLIKGGQVSPQSKWEFTHLQDPKRLTTEQSSTVRAAYPTSNFPSGNLRGYGNFAANLPSGANARGTGRTVMSGKEIGAIFKDPKFTKQVMKPMIAAIAKSMGTSVSKVLQDDKIMKSVARASARWGEAIEKAGGSKGMTGSEMNKAVSSVRITDKTLQVAIKEMKKVSSVNEIRRDDNRPQRKGLSAPVRESIGGSALPYKGMGMAEGNKPMPGISQKQNIAKSQTSSRRASSTQASAREIRSGNPRLTSAQALNLARLRERNAQKAGIARVGSYGAGGGGKTPTFLGMPSMGDPDGPGLKKPQSRMGRMSSGVGRFGMGAGMALSMASMAPMMGADEEGKWMGMDSSTAMMGMMGAGSLLSLAPMLQKSGPAVLGVAAALGAVAITAKILNDNMIKAAEESADFGANIGGASNALNTISALFGEKTPAQRSTQMQMQFSAEEQEQSFGEFQNYLGSELGQKFLKDFESLTGAERFKKLSDYIRSGIASGVLDQKTAMLFAKTVGSALNDSVLGSSAVADLRKNLQESGSKGLLGLAESRKSEVEKSKSVLPGTSEMIGASIQIIQDYSNALALANEEFALGKISYKEFSNVADKAKNAQDNYSKSLKDSLVVSYEGSKYQEISAKGAAAFNNEIKKIMTEDQFEAMKKATETGVLYQAPQIPGMNVNAYEGYAKAELGSAIASGMGADQAIAIMQEIRDNPESDLAKIFAERAGEGNALAVAAFSETADVMAETLGLTNDLNSKFKELGISFLDAGGNLGEFQSFINNLPETIRISMVESLSGMGSQGRKAVISTASMGTKVQQTLLGSKTYKQAVSTASKESSYDSGSARDTKGRAQEAVEDIEKINKQVNTIKDSLGEEIASKLIIAVEISQNGKELNSDEFSKNLSDVENKVLSIQENFPPEIMSAITIDFTSLENIDRWSESSKSFAQNWLVLKQLDPIILTSSIQFLTIDSEGKSLTPGEVLENSTMLQKAWKDLQKTDNTDIKRKAFVNIVSSMTFGKEGEDGKPIDLESAAAMADKNMKELSEKLGGKVYKADPSIVIESLQLMIDADQIKKQGETMLKQAPGLSKAGLSSMAIKAAEQGTALIAYADGQTKAAINAVKFSQKAGDGSDNGGGGGSESPLKSFLKSILDQVKMWTDASTKMGDLNNVKNMFVEQVLKGQGIFDKLKSIKGLPKSAFEQVLGMGPEGTMDFIKKYTKDGKITKIGKSILSASSAAGINESVGMNVLGAETARMQTRAARQLSRRGEDEGVMQKIAGDPAEAAKYLTLQRAVNQNIVGAKKDLKEYLQSQRDIVTATKEEERSRRGIQEITQERFDVVNLDFDIQEIQTRQKFEKEFVNLNGVTIEKMERRVDLIDDEIEGHQDLIDLKQKEIEKLNRSNELDQRKIENYEKQIKAEQDLIDQKQRANELDQRSIETLSRQDQMRQRVSDAVGHDLEIMSDQEDKIRESYDKRFEALDKVAKINDHIVNQQRQQLNLSQALSEGDIYAATAAAQEMRQSQVEFSRDQTRTGLEQGMENSIAGLRTSGGLTREQAEASIKQIKEQSYQTSLLIRDIEDRIYQRNLEMIPIQDEIYRIRKDLILPIENEIAEKNNSIRVNNDEIYRINNDLILPLTTQKGIYTDILADYEKKLGYAIVDLTVAGRTKEQWEATLAATTAYLAQKTALDNINGTWAAIVGNMAQAALLAPQIGSPAVPTSMGVPISAYAGGLMKYATGGVAGDGSRDSVSAMLTPGEFVVRKAMVDKYGIPMLNKINQGSFFMPKFNTGKATPSTVSSGTTTNASINAPMYNNYSVNVSVSNSGASADEIANKTLTKIKQLQNTQIRSGRGF